jgi:hypothetical protein
MVLYLASVGLVAVSTLALFTVSSVSLLNRSDQRLLGVHSSNSPVQGLSTRVGLLAVTGELVSHPESEVHSIMTPKRLPNLIKAKDLPPPAPRSAPGRMQSPEALAGLASKLAPDGEASAIFIETQHTPAQGSSTDKVDTSGVNGFHGAAAGPSPMPDRATASENLTASRPTLVMTDQQRELLFERFLRQLQNGSSVTPQRAPAQRVRIGGWDNHVQALNPSIRHRVLRECGPIHDILLYRDCVASFGVHYR